MNNKHIKKPYDEAWSEADARDFKERCDSQSQMPANDEQKRLAKERSAKIDEMVYKELKDEGYSIK